jgi:hypothetical protein
MVRILLLNPDRNHTCSFYRSGGIVNDLRRHLDGGYQMDVVAWSDIATDWQTIANYDIVMLQRPYHVAALTFCKHVKQMNVKVWLDYDDNLFTVAEENRAWPIFNDPNVQTTVKLLIGLADVVTVTNEDLKTCYSNLNSNIQVVPNAFNDRIFNINRVITDRTNTVIWRGSDTHIFDIMNYAPAINRATSEYPDFMFKYIGYHPWFLEQHSNVLFVRAMDVIDYFDTCFGYKPKLVHVPLHDNVFNRCKSNIAFIEGAYWGAACVVPEFWGEIPGTISYKTQQEYYEGMRAILSGDVDVEKANNESWNFIKDTLLLSNVNKLRVGIIHELMG